MVLFLPMVLAVVPAIDRHLHIAVDGGVRLTLRLNGLATVLYLDLLLSEAHGRQITCRNDTATSEADLPSRRELASQYTRAAQRR